jgi:hypothetical protein
MVRKRTLQERRRSLGCRPRTGVLRASVFGVLKMVLLVFAMLAQEGMNASPVEQDDCRLYPGASIAVPATGRGACVQQIGPPLLFVHYTRQSLLLVQVEESMASALYDNPDLRLVDDGVALLYCPTALLDPLTGTPTSECLFSPEVPGPSALTGTGQIQANVAVDLGGSVGCPSSIHIRGLVNTPGGETFEVRSSLLRFPDSTPGRPCETVEEHIAVGHLGSPSALATRAFPSFDGAHGNPSPTAALPQFDSLQVELLDQVVNLNDREFGLLILLAKLEAADRQLLAHYIDTAGGAQISAGGTVQAAVADPDAQPVTFDTLGDNIRDVWDLLTDITTRRGSGRTIAQVARDLDTDLLALLNNRTPIVAEQLLSHTQSVVATVQDMDGQTVAEFARLSGEAFGDILPFLVGLRGDFQNFRGENCAVASGCAAFKEDLRRFLDESRDNRERLLNEFRGLLDPTFPVDLLRIDVTPLRNILDIAPPFALFLMRQALEGVVPMWKDIPGIVRDQIPEPLEDAFRSPAGFGDGTLGLQDRPGERFAAAMADSLESGSRVRSSLGLADTGCVRAISRPSLRKAFTGLILIGGIGEGIANYVNDAACPTDFTLGATAVAVVGGGGGAGMTLSVSPHPCRTAAKSVAKVFGVLVKISTAIREAYDRCETIDFQSVELEKSLAQCDRLVGLQLPRRTANNLTAVGATSAI